MKHKFLLLIILLFGTVSFITAQTIANFEDGTTDSLSSIHSMGNGTWDDSTSVTFTVVDNPDASGINKSSKVMKYIRRGLDNGGQPWGGFWSGVSDSINVTTNKYVHVMVYKTMISPLHFKLQGGSTSADIEIPSKAVQQTTGTWEDMVFDFSSVSGKYATCAFMPDFQDPTEAGDQIIYFDNIVVNNDSTPAVYTPVPFTTINFEDGTVGGMTLHSMGNGTWDDSTANKSFTIVNNPYVSGIDSSAKVMKYTRRGTDNGGMPWGGFWASLDPKIDLTNGHYVHVKVYKTRISPLHFKLADGPSGALEIPSIYKQQTTGQWEDIVFDFSSLSGAYPTCSFMPDFEDPLTMATDQTIYFDDITVNDDPNPITLEPAFKTIDFEDGTATGLTLHSMGNGTWDDSTANKSFTVVNNPDMSGIDTSAKVMQYIRRGTDNGGMPWGGFWASLDPKINLTYARYVHVKVYKTRISPLHFKVQGGTAGDLEIASKYPQQTTGKWEDIVFDFSSKTGTYPICSFMPDFEDPLTMAADQIIYFDDIRVNNDSTPTQEVLPPFKTIDFEDSAATGLTLHSQGNGTWDDSTANKSFKVVNNPDQSGINNSSKVMEYTRRGTDNGGQPWGGFWADLDPQIDLTNAHYVHVMVYKTRISPLHFKVIGGDAGDLETASMNIQQTTGAWEDIVFDFSSKTGHYPKCSLMPDFQDPFTMAGDQTIYFDNIQVNNDSTPIEPAPASTVVANFEDGTSGSLTLHVMGNGAWDNDAVYPLDSTFTVVDNPDPSGINTSSKVMQFIRRGTDNGGQTWGGFWAGVNPNLDLTNAHYMHVKVYKPKISPLHFKLEGGATGNLEVPSLNVQQATNTWEDIVFDFSTLTGTYPTADLMPDFDTLLGAADVTIYFDDIILNDDPNPITTTGISSHKAFDFNMYPNPVGNVLNLQLNQNMKQLVIYNLMGQKLYEAQDVKKGRTTINTSNFDKGIYLLKLMDNSDLISVKKFIKR